jgi:RNA polymerase sigma factor (sigma-70 family)
MSDGDLIDAARRGDRDAFAALVEDHQRMVEAVAFSAAGRRELVDDVVQDTFVAAWRTLDRLRDAGRVRPWLRGIARNLGRKARRRIKFEAPMPELAATRTPFDDVHDREVTAALTRLALRYREPLVLFYYQQCTAREVGDALGLGEDAVMQRLSRGRKQLGEALACRVEETLERRPSRAGLAVAVVAVVPVRATSAGTSALASLAVRTWRAGAAVGSGARAATLGAARWLASHVRTVGFAVASGAGVLVLVAASAKSEQVAASVVSEPATTANAGVSDTHKDRAPYHAPSKPPALASPAPATMPVSTTLTSMQNAAASCARGARAIASAFLRDDPDHSAWAMTSDGHEYFQPNPAQEAIIERAEMRAADSCGDGPWPEVYTKCEGSLTDVVDGTVNCYPYDAIGELNPGTTRPRTPAPGTSPSRAP